MTDRMFRAAALALCAAAAACTTSAPPAQVTRFHLNQPIARGNVFVTPLDRAAPPTLEQQSYVNAVAAALNLQGFTTRDNIKAAEQIATVDVQRGVQPSALPARSPVTIGVGGGTYGGGLGIGLGTSFGLGKGKSRDITVTTLAVQLKRASDEAVIWEGRAIGRTESDAAPADEIGRLADALFRDFPGPSGQTVEVK